MSGCGHGVEDLDRDESGLHCTVCGLRFVPEGSERQRTRGRDEMNPADWDAVECPGCGNWVPCPPRGAIPLHPICVPPGLPDPSGKMCPGGNREVPKISRWMRGPFDGFPTAASVSARITPPEE